MIWIVILVLIILFNSRSNKSSNIVCSPNHKWIYQNDIMICEVCKKRPEDLM